jgi:hypothetical protein
MSIFRSTCHASTSTSPSTTKYANALPADRMPGTGWTIMRRVGMPRTRSLGITKLKVKPISAEALQHLQFAAAFHARRRRSDFRERRSACDSTLQVTSRSHLPVRRLGSMPSGSLDRTLCSRPDSSTVGQDSRPYWFGAGLRCRTSRRASVGLRIHFRSAFEYFMQRHASPFSIAARCALAHPIASSRKMNRRPILKSVSRKIWASQP